MEQFTPKQIRNGANEGGGERNTAVSDAGPATDMSGVTGAQGPAAAYSELGLAVFDGGDLDQENMTVGEKSFGGGPTGV
jgi:hypothetical protein